MQRIPLKKAKTGMKLAKPVVNDRGMALCGEGTELTDDIIARLKRMEVPQIVVKGHPVQTGETQKSLEQQLADLDERFRRVEGDPLMKKIKNMFAQQITEGAEQE